MENSCGAVSACSEDSHVDGSADDPMRLELDSPRWISLRHSSNVRSFVRVGTGRKNPKGLNFLRQSHRRTPSSRVASCSTRLEIAANGRLLSFRRRQAY